MLKGTELKEIYDTNNIQLPKAYKRVFELGLTNLEPWYFLELSETKSVYSSLVRQYDQHFQIPFARRKDNDDVACFTANDQYSLQEQIVIIHNYAARGSETTATFPNFWDWFVFAVSELVSSELLLENLLPYSF